MDSVGQIERHTQNRVVKLFKEQLHYEYLGNWEEKLNNSNIEEIYLRKFLQKQGYNEGLINRAITQLKTTANNYNESLYTNNKNTYSLLRFGVNVMADIGENHKNVQLIDWKNPEANHFGIAEEVTVFGNREKRPDIVLYVNGIAIAVLELKRSTVSVGDGIRQNITNQQKEFIQSFFSTVQFVFAGNDSEGLRYGSIGTPEKYFLKWKEDVEDSSMYQLDKYLIKMCNKKRLLELMFDFVLFDGGIKKLPRVHQYFGVKAAQESIKKREGGIIWHTQGSGKSIVMVMLAKWILENNPNARVLIITDRDELDKQIKQVFEGADIKMYRTKSGRDLMDKLSQASPRLLCSLVHKFGNRDEEDFDKFIEELGSNPILTIGELYIFVDECHRTQSGKLHKVMMAKIPNGIFIGFTGTPLLRSDKETSLEVFGKYIHTYKFNEGVEDGVILDLVYEARDIEQRISSPERINSWFDVKTKGLNDFQKLEIKKHWASMQHILSSTNRMQQIVNDIVTDFSTKRGLNNNSGNAILVAGSILEACKYYELMRRNSLNGKCALVTSYNPSHRDIVNEDTGANTESDKEYIYKIYSDLLKDVAPEPNKSQSETYEDNAKSKFVKEPVNMKLLIVVAKLLTGFDAPSCTYLYIDKEMKDHGLFQAICRVNRLDTENKDFGYIVDYKGLFAKVEDAFSVYTSELVYDEFKKEDCDILLKNRLVTSRERLEKALEEIRLLCEHVPKPKTDLEYIRYFCGNTENPDDLKNTEIKRTALYKHTVVLVRAYANISADMTEAGFSETEIDEIKKELNSFLRLREMIRNASGEVLDLKTYEADMRYLIDTYIDADVSKRIDPFENQTLLEIVNKIGVEGAIETLPAGIRTSNESIAETITNNVRQKIIKEHLIDPFYFEEMSQLLNSIIKEYKAKRMSYVEYLKKIGDISHKITDTNRDNTPLTIQTPATRALYHNLAKNEEMAIQIDKIVREVKQDDFRGNEPKERIIKAEIFRILQNENEVEKIFAIIKAQREY